jgi:hypothetical protein
MSPWAWARLSTNGETSVGNVAHGEEDFVSWTLFGMGFGGLFGFLVGKAVVGLGWMKEEDIHLD